jgi:hypothetical protein
MARSGRSSLLPHRAVASLSLAGALLAGGVAMAVAQDPGPSPASTAAPVAGPVDPRSEGEGPGLEAEPLLVLIGVVMLGAAAAGGTLLYLRLTRDD